ncbi:cytochrome P450 [Heliocybe sulcata]|uniref:Cytochrome P450 n=1 Tax=Heliocybe sulcata TaxID=5364 RepID=A0A5C3MRD8_9AGAM|nr:cytochrome P450 [Heliocybe sulcata]
MGPRKIRPQHDATSSVLQLAVLSGYKLPRFRCVSGQPSVSLLRPMLLQLTSYERGLLLSFGTGLVSYFIFKKYEPKSLAALGVLLGLLPAIPIALLRTSIPSTLQSILLGSSVFFSTLLCSIGIYRLSPLHPLHAIPGPLPCKLSKLWLTYIASQGKLHLYFQNLHGKYGPIVRVGPNELSVADADLLPSIMGPSGMPKGPLWEGRRISGKKGAGAKEAKGRSLIGARNKQQHAEVRKVWNQAFTPAAVKGYEPAVARRSEQLVDELKTRLAKCGDEGRVDLARWSSFFTFDIMGDIAFGGGFELMRDGDPRNLVQNLAKGLYLPGLTQQIPWVSEFLPYFPFLGQHMKGLAQLGHAQATKRLKEGSVHNDIFHYLLHDPDAEGAQTPFPIVVSNSVSSIIAGSDIAAALSNIFYCLATHPGCYARLRAELDAAFPQGSGQVPNAAALAQLGYLNGVINEALRLYPTVPTSLQRAPSSGSGGHMIGSNLFIPEGTAVFVPSYVLHRSPAYFPDAAQFLPERWLQPQTLRSDAFIPFSSGPANCVGRPFALLALRTAVAHFVQAFDVALAPGYGAEQYAADLRDFFILLHGSLPVVLKPRGL